MIVLGRRLDTKDATDSKLRNLPIAIPGGSLSLQWPSKALRSPIDCVGKAPLWSMSIAKEFISSRPRQKSSNNFSGFRNDETIISGMERKITNPACREIVANSQAATSRRQNQLVS